MFFFFFNWKVFLNEDEKTGIRKGFLKSVHHFWVGKHCASNGHWFAEIPYGLLTALLAYSYGRCRE